MFVCLVHPCLSALDEQEKKPKTAQIQDPMENVPKFPTPVFFDSKISRVRFHHLLQNLRQRCLSNIVFATIIVYSQ